MSVTFTFLHISPSSLLLQLTFYDAGSRWFATLVLFCGRSLKSPITTTHEPDI